MKQNNIVQSELIERYKAKAISDPVSAINQKELGSLFHNRIGFNVQEVAFYLGVSTRTVERFIKSGELSVKRIGRRVIIPRQSIEAWLNRKD